MPLPADTAAPVAPAIRSRPLGGRLHLRAEQVLELDIERAFAAFADPRALDRLTPPWARFEILTPEPLPVGDGALLDYRISLHGLPLRWTTRIGDWRPPFRFADRQLRGPYRRWEHLHLFHALGAERTLMVDLIDYEPPLAALSDRLLVRRDLERILRFRFGAAEALIAELRATRAEPG